MGLSYDVDVPSHLANSPSIFVPIPDFWLTRIFGFFVDRVGGDAVVFDRLGGGNHGFVGELTKNGASISGEYVVENWCNQNLLYNCPPSVS